MIWPVTCRPCDRDLWSYTGVYQHASLHDQVPFFDLDGGGEIQPAEDAVDACRLHLWSKWGSDVTALGYTPEDGYPDGEIRVQEVLA